MSSTRSDAPGWVRAHASRNRTKSPRRHSAQGRWPAARAVASSRKNSSVNRPGRRSGRRRPLNSRRQAIHRRTPQDRTNRPWSSWSTPRVPYRSPRASVAMTSPHGVTRFRSGMTIGWYGVEPRRPPFDVIGRPTDNPSAGPKGERRMRLHGWRRRPAALALVAMALALVPPVGGSTPAIATPAIAAPTGTIKEFPIPQASSGPTSITPGSDGLLWFTESSANKVARITVGGTVTASTVPTASSLPVGISYSWTTLMWFTEDVGNMVAYTDGGNWHEWPLPTAGSSPQG